MIRKKFESRKYINCELLIIFILNSFDVVCLCATNDEVRLPEL